jgi:iron complex transport system permease protein
MKRREPRRREPEQLELELERREPAATGGNAADSYLQYTGSKITVILLLALATAAVGLFAISTGSSAMSPGQVLMTILGWGDASSNTVIWNIRLPRIAAGLLAGAGLSIAGCVMQNLLRNPLASPFTLGISQGAAFGAVLAIIFGADQVRGTGIGAAILSSNYLVTICAFTGAITATLIVLLLARSRGISPEAMILAGVALGSLFSAGTTIIQYFAEDVKVAAVVFWTFGDLGRAAWGHVRIMAAVIGLATLYFLLRRWDYNAMDSGEDTARSLGVEVENVRLGGMFIASLITAVAVAFLGIIGFIGLLGPHLMRRLIGGDHRFLIPGSCVMGSLLLIASDALARTLIAPVTLPVGAVTSFMGAPLFLYLLFRGCRRR